MFIKYPHLERVGKDEVEGLLEGTCYIFPKVDGTNGSLWIEDANTLYGGSRNRDLTLDKDNHGFYAWAVQQENIHIFLKANPKLRLYGEWLVAHTFKNYREDAWRKFYVFDVGEVGEDGEMRLLPYDEYKPLLEEYKVEYIPAVKIIKNPSQEELQHELDNNFYLCADTTKPGEGIVIKNYEFKSKWGHQTWAKLVREEFKEGNLKEFGTPEAGTEKVEQKIVDEYVTVALCEKEYEKVMGMGMVDPQKNIIPRTLETIWHCLITEETWNFLKEFNNPTIDFKRLKALTIRQVKKNLPQLF
jgi:hypothetical protein